MQYCSTSYLYVYIVIYIILTYVYSCKPLEFSIKGYWSCLRRSTNYIYILILVLFYFSITYTIFT